MCHKYLIEFKLNFENLALKNSGSQECTGWMSILVCVKVSDIPRPPIMPCHKDHCLLIPSSLETSNEQ
jgi:hypothetical protein